MDSSVAKFLSEWSLWIFVIALASFSWIWWRKPHKRFPPGPRGVPIVGILPFVDSSLPNSTFRKWSQHTYGPVMSVRFGMKDIVTLNNYDVINQALVKQPQVFAGRPPIHLYEKELLYQGVTFQDYNGKYKTMKSFMHVTMNKYGVGKKGMENIIVSEMEYFIEHLKPLSGEPVYLKIPLQKAIINILSRLVLGARYESYEDSEFEKIVFHVMKLTNAENITALLCVLIYPLSRHILPPVRKAYQENVYHQAALIDALRPAIERHKKAFDPNNASDVIDEFLKEQRVRKEKVDETFSDKELEVLCWELFFGGAETISMTILWLFVGILDNPVHYKRVQDEIDALGDRPILMENRRSMPYTCAFLQEIFRVAPVIPSGLNHRVTADVELCGYHIPKGTEVFHNIWAANRDPDLWEDPDVFDPLRHLDESGKFVYSSKVITFSVGPRSCLGEGLARMASFLIFVNFLRSYSVSLDSDSELHDFEHGINIGLYGPQPFKIVIQER